MPKAKVQHALFTYTVKKDGRTLNELALRGAVIDLDDSELERGLELGALIEADAPLKVNGNMPVLPESASGEEILNWVLAATPDEVKTLAQNRPNLSEQLAGAMEVASTRETQQQEMLGKAIEIAEEVNTTPPPLSTEEAEALAQAEAEALAKAEAEAEEKGQNSEPQSGSEVLDPTEVIKGNVQAITSYLSTNPGEAQAVLEAENTAAESEKREPRAGVVRAVQVAASHG